VHGGAWVGGAKDELAGYFKLVASNGYVVAGPHRLSVQIGLANLWETAVAGPPGIQQARHVPRLS
jgi:hypothetical protein